MNNTNTSCWNTFPEDYDNTWCAPEYDGFLCWPATPSNNMSLLPCPENKGLIKGENAYRFCRENHTWEKRNNKSYTHYENCFPRQISDIFQMCDAIGTCGEIFRTTRTIELVGLSFSLVSLIISLFIFFHYRVLKNNRTKIHKNLFIATLLQVVFRLINYVDQEITPPKKFIEQAPGLETSSIALLEYTKTAMFMWMFIEGLYLHNMITVTVFQEYSYIKLYVYVGWMVPGIMTAAWLLTMLITESEWRFYFFLPYYWILEGPRCIIILVNLLFLINIIRVLILKLRESHTSEIQQVRKAVRAAIFLLPLMGIANIFFWVDYRFDKSWKLSLWSYTSYFLNTFQGFFVAILYCFLNGEVQAAVKNSFYLHMYLRNHDYTPCRNLTLISSAAEPDTNHDNKPGSNWIRHCFTHQVKTSPNKKNIKECEENVPRLSNDDTDTTIAEDRNSESKV